jgi:hypothetical protein
VPAGKWARTGSASQEFTAQVNKKWVVTPDAAPAVGGPNRITYTVEVEEGIQLTGGPEGSCATTDVVSGQAQYLAL